MAFRFESGNASPPFDVTTEGDQAVAEGGQVAENKVAEASAAIARLVRS